MEAWQGLESLTRPTLDSVLGVLFPYDNTAFECFVYLGERRIKMRVAYDVPMLKEGILLARRVAQHLSEVLFDVIAITARQNQGSWLHEDMEDEGHPLSHDITRQRIAFEGLTIYTESIEFWFDDGELWAGHQLYSDLRGHTLESEIWG